MTTHRTNTGFDGSKQVLSDFKQPRSATGPADLLRRLAIRASDTPLHLILEATTEGWFGYQLTTATDPQSSDEAQSDSSFSAQNHANQTSAQPAYKTPLKMAFVQTISRRESREAPTIASSDSSPKIDPLRPDDETAKARENHPQITFEDIIPAARLLPALRRHLGASRAGTLDIDKLTDQVASGTLPARLPRRRIQRWHTELVVVLDFSERLWPYRWDMHQLAKRLLRLCGRSGLSLRIIERGPLWHWSDWCAHHDVQLVAYVPPDLPWKMPTAGTPVLLVSDLGLLFGPESMVCHEWEKFIGQLRAAQLRPIVLAPLGEKQLHAGLCRHLPILRWSPDAPAHPVRSYGTDVASSPAGIEDLLAMVAATRRADPPLLRAMRKLNPVAPMNAGLEGAVWCHPAVETGVAATVKTSLVDAHLLRFSKMQPDLLLKLNELRRLHHAHLRRVVEHEEMLLWAAHAPVAVEKSRQTDIHNDIHIAARFMERLAALLKTSGSDAGVWLQVANSIVYRADRRMRESFNDVLNDLLSGVIQAQGGKDSVPDWADPGKLPPGRNAMGWLVRDAESGYLVLQGQAPKPRQTSLGSPLRLNHGVRIRRGGRYEFYQAGALPVALSDLDQQIELELLTAHESLTITTVARPRGACGWSVSSGGLQVQAAGVIGDGITWSDSDLSIHAGTGRVIGNIKRITIGKHRIEYGIDESFGIHANLHLATRHGHATQRLRWIEPGTFLMGSPTDEPERFDDEGPQHPVTLTQGFWLADTACTQALWQAVMGDNPSHFQDDVQNPVEEVSWEDVQGFLRALEALLPGSEARLPTEAQWEYACRAGTTTAFSFGAQITPAQVNYDGNFPYAGGSKGEYRQRTLPVKSLPANAWGLYEMHGNVREWCADGQRTYDTTPQQDPEGPADGPQRALRGGSWIFDAGVARSAFRYGFGPGFRHHILGFRLCLRSSSPVRPGGPGQARRPEGDMPAVPARDAPAPSLAQRAKKNFSRSDKPGGNKKP